MALRFFEAHGRVRKALSVIKNRGGGHEDKIREYRVDLPGLRIGEPLTDFDEVLTGTPAFTGNIDQLLADGSIDDDS